MQKRDRRGGSRSILRQCLSAARRTHPARHPRRRPYDKRRPGRTTNSYSQPILRPDWSDLCPPYNPPTKRVDRPVHPGGRRLESSQAPRARSALPACKGPLQVVDNLSFERLIKRPDRNIHCVAGSYMVGRQIYKTVSRLLTITPDPLCTNILYPNRRSYEGFTQIKEGVCRLLALPPSAPTIGFSPKTGSVTAATESIPSRTFLCGASRASIIAAPTNPSAPAYKKADLVARPATRFRRRLSSKSMRRMTIVCSLIYMLLNFSTGPTRWRVPPRR